MFAVIDGMWFGSWVLVGKTLKFKLVAPAGTDLTHITPLHTHLVWQKPRGTSPVQSECTVFLKDVSEIGKTLRRGTQTNLQERGYHQVANSSIRSEAETRPK